MIEKGQLHSDAPKGSLFYLLSISILLIIIGCGTANTMKTKETIKTPPAWVKGDYRLEDKVCTIGISGPTYFYADARLTAAENARKELARTISIKIESIMIEMRTERSSLTDDASFSQISSWATSAVVQNSEVIDYWTDSDGSFQKNSTFVLCCMPRSIRIDTLSVNRSGIEPYINIDK